VVLSTNTTKEPSLHPCFLPPASPHIDNFHPFHVSLPPLSLLMPQGSLPHFLPVFSYLRQKGYVQVTFPPFLYLRDESLFNSPRFCECFSLFQCTFPGNPVSAKLGAEPRRRLPSKEQLSLSFRVPAKRRVLPSPLWCCSRFFVTFHYFVILRLLVNRPSGYQWSTNRCPGPK